MDINAHNLPLLASLSVLLDERNVTRAAERLGISQPALSAQLARLRDVFGDPLLTPAASGKGMVITPRGLQLKEPLRKALRQLDDVVSQRERFDPKTSERTFAIGANDNATAIIAPRLIHALEQNGAARIRLAFRAASLSAVTDQLEQGGSAVVVGGSVAGGVMINPATTTGSGTTAARSAGYAHHRGTETPGTRLRVMHGEGTEKSVARIGAFQCRATT